MKTGLAFQIAGKCPKALLTILTFIFYKGPSIVCREFHGISLLWFDNDFDIVGGDKLLKGKDPLVPPYKTASNLRLGKEGSWDCARG